MDIPREKLLEMAQKAREVGLTNAAIILENQANGIITADEAKRLMLMDYAMNVTNMEVAQ